MDDNRLAKVAKSGKPNSQATWTTSKRLAQKLDINISQEILRMLDKV